VSILVGHSLQRTQLSQLAREERLPSALIFSGIHGIGKFGAAQELAKQLLCATANAPQGGCGSCRTCSLFDSNNHPDLHRLTFSGERGATVDDIRIVLENMSLKPFMGGRKVAILNDADEISIVGANILLKSLEEPRPETYFILIVANPSRLPSTILSRCQRIFFDRLSTEELQTIAEQRGLPQIDASTVALAEGSAVGLDSLQARAEMHDDVKSVLDRAFNGDATTVGRAAQEWGGEKNLLRERLAFLRTTIRQKLLESAFDRDAAAVWGNALQNALDAEYLILDRHVNPTLCLLKTLQGCNRQLSATYQSIPNSAPSLGELLLNER
jgi:DNA polymerase-3 subunit delta'